MENKYVLAANGQEVQKEDYEGVAEAAGLADDRLLWEFIRTQTGSSNPQRGIIPYGVSGWPKFGSLSYNSMFVGESATGAVKVLPFRAVVGSTTTAVGIEQLRGSKSGYIVGGSNLYTSVAINANAAGNPRWTLIYASVTPDATGLTDNRYTKDPSTSVVTNPSVAVYKKCTVSLSTVDGTAAASPSRPAVPSDGGGAYIVPLCYVWVPNGFTAGSSTVAREHIHEVANCFTVNSATGGTTLMPANGSFKTGGTVDTRQGHNQVKRPGAYLPSTMVGGEERLIPIQLGLSPASHADGDLVDDSVDWRNRYFVWDVFVNDGTATGDAFASDRNITGTAAFTGCSSGIGNFGTAPGVDSKRGWGQSFVADGGTIAALGISGDNGVVLVMRGGAGAEGVSQLGTTSEIVALYVKASDGKLYYKKSGSPSCQILVWLKATAPYGNYAPIT